MPLEMLVPIGMFVLGIIVSLSCGGLGIGQILRARGSETELGRTAAYASPFKDSQHDLADSITRTPKP